MARHTRAKPSFSLDLQDGRSVLLEGPCHDCAEHAKTCQTCTTPPSCDLCHGSGWVVTEAGQNLLAFVQHHAQAVPA